jgi:hypothetical protein
MALLGTEAGENGVICKPRISARTRSARSLIGAHDFDEPLFERLAPAWGRNHQ